jgi:anion-transporting  ArsA/GET3 family ATPase
MPDQILAWTRPLLKTLALHRTLAMAREAGVKVAELAHRVRELIAILKDAEQTQIWAVMLAEQLPDRETQRMMRDLHTLGLPPKALFVNRILFEEDVGDCRRCSVASRWQHAMLASLGKRYTGTEIYVVRNFATEIAGKAALNRLTDELWQLA